MLPFGHVYAEHGAGVLRLLLCAKAFFRAVIALFSAVSRVQGRGLRAGADRARPAGARPGSGDPAGALAMGSRVWGSPGWAPTC